MTKRSERPAAESGPRILGLQLLARAAVADLKEFYARSLGLEILDEGKSHLTFLGGTTPITFRTTESGETSPFYHFAFNIPENKIREAYAWQKARTPLLPIPDRLRSPGYPEEVVNYSHWNAHSIFFLDPAGNVVEYIARHDLNNASEGPFGSRDILYASEIGLVVDDVPETARSLGEAVGWQPYRTASDSFTALGDEQGLLLIMRRGRILNFNPADPSKAASVFATTASVRASAKRKHQVPGYPYEISLET